MNEIIVTAKEFDEEEKVLTLNSDRVGNGFNCSMDLKGDSSFLLRSWWIPDLCRSDFGSGR